MTDPGTEADEQGYERVCARIMGVAEEESAAMFGGRNVSVLRELNAKLLESKSLRRVWSDLHESRRADAVRKIGLAAAQEFVQQALKAHQVKSAPPFLGPDAEYDLGEARLNLDAVQRTIDLIKEHEQDLEHLEPRPLDSDLVRHFRLIERVARRPPHQETATKRSAPTKAANPRETLVLLLHLYEEQLREVIVLQHLQPQPKDKAGRPSEPGTLIADACHAALQAQPVLKYRMQRAEELVQEFLDLPDPPSASTLERRVHKALARTPRPPGSQPPNPSA